MTLKVRRRRADRDGVRVDRVIHESEAGCAVTRFHAGTTVVHGYTGSSIRYASSLVDAVCGDSDGVHVELHLGGRELAVFRPDDEPHRVIDVDGAIDISDEFENVAGVIDLLVPLRLSRLRAEGAMLVCSDDVEEAPKRSRVRPLALLVAVAAVAVGAVVATTPVQMGVCLAVAVVAFLAWAVAGRRRSARESRADTGAIDAIDANIAAAQEATGIDDPLPVIVVDMFRGLRPGDKAAALDAAVRASANGQVIVVTDDEEVVDLARFREIAGDLAVVTPTLSDPFPAASA